MTMRSLLSLVTLAAALPANPLVHALSTPGIRTQPRSSTSVSSPSPRILESTIEETLTSNENNLSPFLQGMVDEQRELQMNVGKAMDVLRKDYPYFLKRAPDYSIYHDSISVSASDGKIQLSKLPSYKKAFSGIRTMLSFLYDTDRSVIQSRMVYDSTKTQIRVSYNAMLVPKMGGKPVHVDGISVYSIDLSATIDKDGNKRDGAGKIIEHRIEKLLMNGAALVPPFFSAFGLETTGGQRGGQMAGSWN
mmetsp:Transcript_10075/g.18126  ORF Transcript_10075/g.18126 Transcript_10075/m.18126 type:complete len:249 (+) Transcript_10075:116-862(+)